MVYGPGHGAKKILTKVELEVTRGGEVSPAIVAYARQFFVQHVEHLFMPNKSRDERQHGHVRRKFTDRVMQHMYAL